MFRPMMFRLFLAGFLALAISSSMWAQTESKSTSKTSATKFRGRLPNYYARIVTSQQRTEIYAIQSKYHEQIEELEAKLDELKMKQSEEIYAVLTPEQKETLKTLQNKSKTAAKTQTADSKAGTEE